MAIVSDFLKSLWRRLGGDKERTMYGKLVTASQVRDGEKELKQKFLQMESAIKNILSPNFSEERSADNLDVWVQSKYTTSAESSSK